MRTTVVLSIIFALAVLVPFLVNRWAKRRNDEVDDYHERDTSDPPVMGGGPWPSGGSGGPL